MLTTEEELMERIDRQADVIINLQEENKVLIRLLACEHVERLDREEANAEAK